MAIIVLFVACDNGNNNTHVHDWGEWIITKEPGITEDGEETRTCKLDSSHTEKRPIPKIVPYENIDEIIEFLSKQPGGITANDPIPLFVAINMGTMTEETSGWQLLLNAIAQSDKFVALDLSACLMNGTEFDPITTISTGKNRIVEIVFPDTAESIKGVYPSPAFGSSSPLRSFNGKGLASIGTSIFYRCQNLKMTSLPKSITVIDSYAFNNSGIEEIILHEGIISIGMGAFGNNNNLRRISLPNSLENAGVYQFSGCSNLEEVTMSANLTSIYNSNFNGCTSLVSFVLRGTGALSTVLDGRALVRNGNELVAYPSATGIVSLPENITRIGSDSFSGCVGLTELILHDGIISISGGNYGVFSGCNNLYKVTLGTIVANNWIDPNTAGGGGNFPGNLHDVYFADGGGAGTYITTRTGNGSDNPVWIKQ